ncbi:hypothetical protein [Streptomyces sp. R44]|uniref:Uncharacterized protein n=1 Tax=Streptomyces sp. R44 TaxID=3238633 RepID=A0AB39T0U0_9ACTN
MRVTRRSVRTAAVATGAAALLLPATGAAFAADSGSGQTTSDQTASDQAVFWRNVDLADGSLAKAAKVVKLPDGHTATFFAGKDGRPYVKLSVPGGTSWTYDFHGVLVGQK